ncbi:M23 family metallopeptidase [Arthrobacter sp. Y-9]|uniref:M23 family metallopeptidase n=1 Tax=Arthrobacter sp. Y-9 TaxID=3039385 RepID=UPI00241D6A34|nr:M23 family metallopeptidase [Arthrobacter sp. Y-9]WFR84485.1 M23 family metallopeptidase [Arthrobacter sp. Y-9]
MRASLVMASAVLVSLALGTPPVVAQFTAVGTPQAPPVATDHVRVPALGAPVTAEAEAFIAFETTTLQSRPKGARERLNVAEAGRHRPAAGHLSSPLEVLIPTSPFGPRINPLTGEVGEIHWGQDYGAACGTLVYAADAGRVRNVGWSPYGGGNRIEIDHGNGLVTTYNHLSGIAVNKGESIEVGQVIAKVGTTGSSTGCHLHFETIKNGKYVNPLQWVLDPIKQVDRLDRIAFTDYSRSGAKSAWTLPGGSSGTEGIITPEAEKDGGKIPPGTKVPPARPEPTHPEHPTPQPSTPGPTPPSTPGPTGTPTPSPTPTEPSPTGPTSPTPTPSSTETAGPTAPPSSGAPAGSGSPSTPQDSGSPGVEGTGTPGPTSLLSPTLLPSVLRSLLTP